MKLNIIPFIIGSAFLAACASSPANTESVGTVARTESGGVAVQIESGGAAVQTDGRGAAVQMAAESESESEPGGGLVISATEPGDATADAMTYSMSFYDKVPNENSSVKIQYPVFSGGVSEKLNALVSDKVQSLGELDTEYFSEDSALTVDYQSAVTLQNGKIVSMIFWGDSNIEGSAHGSSDLYTLNIDLQTMKEVTFDELYKTDTGFSEAFFEKAFFPSEPITSYDADRFSEMLNLQTPEYQPVDPFSIPDTVSCFLKPDGIVLSMPAVHATGSDHFEAQINYGDIQEFYRLQQNYWES